MTIDRVRLGYYWPGMTSAISAFVHRCPLCQRVKAKLPAKAGLLSMSICSSPNKRLHINLYGPLKTSAAGNHYVVVMTDAFTKYVELAAIPNKTEDQVAKVLFERWFCRFSTPTVMISDQGKEFCNELVNRHCALWDVHPSHHFNHCKCFPDDVKFWTDAQRRFGVVDDDLVPRRERSVLGLLVVVLLLSVSLFFQVLLCHLVRCPGYLVHVRHVTAVIKHPRFLDVEIGQSRIVCEREEEWPCARDSCRTASLRATSPPSPCADARPSLP
jgi:hypothetical protein